MWLSLAFTLSDGAEGAAPVRAGIGEWRCRWYRGRFRWRHGELCYAGHGRQVVAERAAKARALSRRRAASRSRVEARGYRVGEDLNQNVPEPGQRQVNQSATEPEDIAGVGEGVVRSWAVRRCLPPGPVRERARSAWPRGSRQARLHRGKAQRYAWCRRRPLSVRRMKSVSPGVEVAAIDHGHEAGGAIVVASRAGRARHRTGVTRPCPRR